VHFRLELFEYGKPYRCTYHEDATVPPVITGCNVLRRQFCRGFSTKRSMRCAPPAVVAQADVAEAGVGTRGGMPSVAMSPACAKRAGNFNRCVQRGKIVDSVICRHGNEDGVWPSRGR